MKITGFKPIPCVLIFTDGEGSGTYTRYGEKCWYMQMGESDEPVYDCDEIEKLYQEELANHEITLAAE